MYPNWPLWTITLITTQVRPVYYITCYTTCMLDMRGSLLLYTGDFDNYFGPAAAADRLPPFVRLWLYIMTWLWITKYDSKYEKREHAHRDIVVLDTWCVLNTRPQMRHIIIRMLWILAILIQDMLKIVISYRKSPYSQCHIPSQRHISIWHNLVHTTESALMAAVYISAEEGASRDAVSCQIRQPGSAQTLFGQKKCGHRQMRRSMFKWSLLNIETQMHMLKIQTHAMKYIIMFNWSLNIETNAMAHLESGIVDSLSYLEDSYQSLQKIIWITTFMILRWLHAYGYVILVVLQISVSLVVYCMQPPPLYSWVTRPVVRNECVDSLSTSALKFNSSKSLSFVFGYKHDQTIYFFIFIFILFYQILHIHRLKCSE